MGRPKKQETEEDIEETTEEVVASIEKHDQEEINSHISPVNTYGGVAPLTQEFGNGDLNVLRDKINELVELANK